MTKVIVNNENKTIVITKAFNNKASVYGTPEYRTLVEIKKDHPGFEVIIKRDVKHSGNPFKGLNYKQMEAYIAKHDDENGTKMAEFNTLRSEVDAAHDLGIGAVNFTDIKRWFFDSFPEIKAFVETREKILNNAKAA